jgi:pimeloyl-ACP methyl ester carboxylesterase
MNMENEEKRDGHEAVKYTVDQKDITLSSGVDVRIYDAKPEKLDDEIPVFFAQAGLVPPYIYGPALRSIVESGRRTLVFDQPRSGKPHELSPAEREKVKGFPEEEISKAIYFIEAADNMGITRTDMIAHSEGCAWAGIAALLRPGLIRNMVLSAPSGLIGKDSLPRLAKGFFNQGKPLTKLDAPVTDEDREDARKRGYDLFGDLAPSEEPIRQKIGIMATIEAVKQMVISPVRTVKEIWGMSELQIHELLKTLSEDGEHPVGITVMVNQNDPVFPAAKMEEILRGLPYVNRVSTPYHHGSMGEFQKYPRECARQLILLRDLLVKRKSPTAGTAA